LFFGVSSASVSSCFSVSLPENLATPPSPPITFCRRLPISVFPARSWAADFFITLPPDMHLSFRQGFCDRRQFLHLTFFFWKRFLSLSLATTGPFVSSLNCRPLFDSRPPPPPLLICLSQMQLSPAPASFFHFFFFFFLSLCYLFVSEIARSCVSYEFSFFIRIGDYPILRAPLLQAPERDGVILFTHLFFFNPQFRPPRRSTTSTVTICCCLFLPTTQPTLQER